VRILSNRKYLSALIGYRVAAGVEHTAVLNLLGYATVVDIGANRGQFALVSQGCHPEARVISFEPLEGPASTFEALFRGNDSVQLHRSAVGPEVVIDAQMHLSASDDSSSMLPITGTQSSLFPGTEEICTRTVQVAPLDVSVSADRIAAPALLKLDVQGFELQALEGCVSLLSCFRWVYVECSFVELYEGQAFADEVIAWLRERNFRLIGVFNMAYDQMGVAIQADFLFTANELCENPDLQCQFFS